jgi:hypothetical protein
MQPTIETDPIVETGGDDWIWPLQFLGDDDSPVDLTGCVFDGAAIKWRGGAIDLTQESRLSVDETGGVLTVTIARADTASVPTGRRSRAVIPIIDTLDHKSTLLIIPIEVIAP